MSRTTVSVPLPWVNSSTTPAVIATPTRPLISETMMAMRLTLW